MLAGGYFLLCILAGLMLSTVVSVGLSVLVFNGLDSRTAWSFQAVEMVRSLVVLPFQAAASVGLLRVVLDVAQGEPPSFSRLLTALRSVPQAMVLQLPVTLALMIPNLLTLGLTAIAPQAASLVSLGWSCLVLPVLALFLMSWWLFSLPGLLLVSLYLSLRQVPEREPSVA